MEPSETFKLSRLEIGGLQRLQLKPTAKLLVLEFLFPVAAATLCFADICFQEALHHFSLCQCLL